MVRAARKSRGLTQQTLAQRAGIDQASVSRSERGRDAEFNTINRLLAGAGHRLYSAPTRRDDAAAVAAEIRGSLRNDDKDRALRALIQLSDNLLAEQGLTRAVLAIAEPESTKSGVWDAALAGVVAWRLRDAGLPTPEWTESPERFLANPEFLRIDPSDPLPPADRVPVEFARRGVLAWRDTFESV